MQSPLRFAAADGASHSSSSREKAVLIWKARSTAAAAAAERERALHANGHPAVYHSTRL